MSVLQKVAFLVAAHDAVDMRDELQPESSLYKAHVKFPTLAAAAHKALRHHLYGHNIRNWVDKHYSGGKTGVI